MSGCLWVLIIAYSITKHHLFNIKLIAIQMVTFTLWIFILMRIFLAQNFREAVTESSLLIITVIFGIMLIRGILHQIEQREKIEKLAGELKTAYGHIKHANEHLEEKVAEQTVEIRKSYEVEKKARVELEKLNEAKDHFITTTQHELRTPATAIRWYAESMIKEKTSKNLSEPLKGIEEASKKLLTIIEDFISTSER